MGRERTRPKFKPDLLSWTDALSLSQEEILRIIDQAIEEAEASSLKDLGKVMKSVMPRLQGKADGKLINQLVKERLSP